MGHTVKKSSNESPLEMLDQIDSVEQFLHQLSTAPTSVSVTKKLIRRLHPIYCVTSGRDIPSLIYCVTSGRDIPSGCLNAVTDTVLSGRILKLVALDGAELAVTVSNNNGDGYLALPDSVAGQL